jgi:radical SAM superfamily enzyme YgiQ (UPF0313 family)
MRVLFVNSNRCRALVAAPPIGLAYVATAAADAGHDVRFTDVLFSKEPAKDLALVLQKFNPEVVGVSVRNIDNVIRQRFESYVGGVESLIRTIRAVSRAKIVIGGPAISILGDRALDNFDADFAAMGEGEAVMPALLDALSGGESGEGIDGLYCRQGSCGASTPPSRLPRFGGSGLERWIDWRLYARRGATWPIQTRRGCPLGCSYCTYPAIEGSATRFRAPEEVADEVARVARTIAPKTFEFVDSTFTIPESHAMRICDEIVRRNLRVTLSTMGGNPLGISAQLLGMMKRAGFNSIMVTPESASETMLRSYRKGFGVDAVERAAEAVRDSGLPSAWFFMLGGPGETEQTVEETMRFIERRLRRSNCLVVVMTGVRIFPGSELARAAFESGYLPPGTDLAQPFFYFSPALEEAHVIARINQAIARNTNVVHSCEDGHSLLQRVVEGLLRTAGMAPPFWRFIPRVLRTPPLPYLRAHHPPAGGRRPDG